MVINRYSFTAGAVCALVAGGAFADVTAEEVWADLEQTTRMQINDGLTIGSKSSGDGVVTIEDFVVEMRDDDNDAVGFMTYTINKIMLEEQGDGTVRMTMSDTIPMMFGGKSEDGEDFAAKLTLSQEGLSVVYSGTPDELAQDYSASSASIVLEDAGPSVVLNGENKITLSGISGRTVSEIGDLRKMTQTAKAANIGIAIDMDIIDEDEPGSLKLTGDIADLDFAGEASLPMLDDYDDFQRVMNAGFGFSGGYSLGKGSMSADIQMDAEPPASVVASFDGSQVSVAMDSQMLSYESLSRNLDLSMSFGAFPVPIKAKIAEYGGALTMPLAPSEDGPADFRAALTLADLTVNDEIWGLFDPAAALPRDPATLRADISGKAKLFAPFYDEETMAKLEETGEAPGEIHSAKIETLEVSAVGAKVTGDGELTFDNSDLETFDGMPVPIGMLNFQISGANGLIDSLVKMGFIPQDEAMMTRMMLSMFARATGDDEMASEIEFREGGEIYANGQRLR